MLKRILYLLPPLLFLGLVVVLNRPWGTIPALGKLLTPFHGYFQQIEGTVGRGNVTLDFTDLQGEVEVFYDSLAVPHIFAQNDADLYFAQGFVVAQDRLWQMEFYTLAASGRLSEIVGPTAISLDQYHRRIGMAETAERIVSWIKSSDPKSWEILEAYAAGVNAYISTLNDRSIPLEYKILGYRPERWTPYKSILMLMNMRLDLSRGSDDFRMSQILHAYGKEITSNLFPDYPSIESPIIPVGTSWDFDPLPRPEQPERITVTETDDGPPIVGLAVPSPQPEIGSNNWVVSGSRTESGLPLLANDPHLSLTLPSIWYQIQLHTPEVNVYGVCLPGTPAVIIGFNQDIAWGVTNMAPDVMDFYEIQFKDESKSEYWYDESWHQVRIRVDTLKVKGEPDLLDTVYSTHHGPVVYHQEAKGNFEGIPVGHAMRWGANEFDGSDLLTFHLLNRAQNYDDYREALSHFLSPAQNFIFASNENDIALIPNGRVPLKWTDQGKFLLDGRLPSHDWQGWIPVEHRPLAKNPDQGFLSSANQFPTDPTYPYYLGWSFTHSSRAIRINERLAEMTQATASDMNDLLNDNYNWDAARILPLLLAELEGEEELLHSAEFEVLKDWDLENDAESIAATIFETWVPILQAKIWEDDFPDKLNVRFPSLDRTFDLLVNEPNAIWYDDKRSEDQIETRSDVVRESFKTAVESLRARYGEGMSDAWKWANVKNTTVAHLVPNFTMFSRSGIWNGGGPRIVNATSSGHGPSWRMVVELDRDWPTAHGIYPGGQSGNPGSPYYDNMIDRWAEGKLYTLYFLKDRPSVSTISMISTLTLLPEKKQ